MFAVMMFVLTSLLLSSTLQLASKDLSYLKSLAMFVCLAWKNPGRCGLSFQKRLTARFLTILSLSATLSVEAQELIVRAYLTSLAASNVSAQSRLVKLLYTIKILINHSSSFIAVVVF